MDRGYPDAATLKKKPFHTKWNGFFYTMASCSTMSHLPALTVASLAGIYNPMFHQA
ncbi:hypothetical protein ACFFGV_00395 [Pontibacillus salicampi]|uniref:Uncharacterized protein n=1 Tax=Pontibacillus salicampi TaxID=1449801 RepID=A0ABV6LI72_9BACI